MKSLLDKKSSRPAGSPDQSVRGSRCEVRGDAEGLAPSREVAPVGSMRATLAKGRGVARVDGFEPVLVFAVGPLLQK